MEHRPEEGQIVDGNVRYVLMRPDVLMGVSRHLGHGGEHDFLAALETSAFVHAQASFAAYRDDERFGRADFLASTCRVAGSLGWGVWSLTAEASGARIVRVDNSPFAAGYGAASRPVCSPITGVLRAIALVGYGHDVVVEELECAAQGANQCLFRFPPPRSI